MGELANNIEEYVVVEKDGKYWGIEYSDGQCTAYDWVDIEKAQKGNPKFATTTESFTYADSPYVDILKQGRLSFIRKTSIYELLNVSERTKP